MRGLQLRIALILVASICAVMLVATGATIMLLSAGEPTRMIGPMVDHIQFSQRQMGSAGKPASGIDGPQLHDRVQSSPANGKLRPDLTASLKSALATAGLRGDALVTEDPATGQPVASYDLGDGTWGVYDFPRPMPPPTDVWLVLGSWLFLVLVGVGGVALFFARLATAPFAVLERAVTSIGRDGVLPHVEEIGSGEVRHVAATLNRLSDRLRSSMESRMRLVAAAGHDLRTPMTRMRLRAEFLPEEERAAWLADLDELDVIADSAIRLVKEEAAAEDQTSILLAPFLEQLLRELREAELPAAVGQLADGVSVAAGPLSLRRAIRNLVINAATHGRGATVSLLSDAGTAHIVITDSGPGIPRELLDHVFEPFFRAEPGRQQRIKGAGLGMAIAKDIIERFGGTIHIANQPEGGLRQIITLPEIVK